MTTVVGEREHPYGWVIVAVSTISLALGFGAGGVVSVLMKPLEEEFGWFRADISMAYTAYTIGSANALPTIVGSTLRSRYSHTASASG